MAARHCPVQAGSAAAAGQQVRQTGCVPEDGPAGSICSAKACRSEGVWVLAWNNPKLHTPDRRKAWVACDDHVASLSGFLSARGFLRDTIAVTEWDGEDLPGS